jgi:phosphoribosylaminoimidazolecarboxamide formyltransferase/IMP cyclohydrolase
MRRVRRALLSVHDKTGVVEFAKGLAELGVDILSTGGTATALRTAGMDVRDVAGVTGFPEMLDGRVKTLHPRIHGGILARRESPVHMAALEQHAIAPIDLVAVTLYPFEQTVATPGVTPGEAIDQIDVGGPALIRAAAKNHASVAVVTDPTQYGAVLAELRAGAGLLSSETRHSLARVAFRRTADYDAAIAAYLLTAGAAPAPPPAGPLPAHLKVEANRVRVLRYGENPHQEAAFYQFVGQPRTGIAAGIQLHGPEVSYNNLLDLSAALGLLLEFEEPAAVVIKHTNPGGVALGKTVAEAIRKAKACDPVSIYGGIVGLNRMVDLGVVNELSGIFVEILFAPAYDRSALEEIRRTKQKARVLEVPCERPSSLIEYRSVLGGLLAQSADLPDLNGHRLTVVSRRAPTAAEHAALRFAWAVAKHVKSNAIVLAKGDHVVGIGAGQMNRADAARLAVGRATELGLDTRETVCASDAFFPFRDGFDIVARAGATAVIQPGGSQRDGDVIAAADEYGIAMVMTGIRHFKH